MSYTPKYQLGFKDLLGGDCMITISLKSYLGAVTAIYGTSKPCTLTFSGDEDNIYDPIRKCRAKINIYEPPQELIDDLTDIDDTAVLVTITAPNRRFDGFITPDDIVRPLDLTGSSLSLQAVDIFSIMKGKILVDANGRMPYGKQTLRWFMERCLALGANEGFGYSINFINDYHLNNSSGLQLLDEMMFDASSFKGDDGRSNDSYDTMERFAKSLFSFMYFAEGKLNFITPVSKETTTYRNVATMTRGMQSGFLVGNLESLGAVRGTKEVSCKYEFGSNNGLLRNFNFGEWVGGVPTNWAIDRPDTISRVGTGRPESKYGMKVINKTYTSPKNGVFWTTITQTAVVSAGVAYSLDITLKYFDYKADKISNADIAYLRMNVTMVDTNGAARDLKFDKDFSSDLDGKFIPLSLESKDGEQVVSLKIKEVPADGTITVSWQQKIYSNYIMYAITYPKTITAEYYGAIFSVDRSGKEQTGIKDYLTQVRDYTQLLSVDNTTIGNAPDDGISGGIYTKYAITYDGTIYGAEMLFPYLFKSGDSTPRTALHQLLRAYMATSRKAARKIEFTVLDNQIQFSDILAINDQGRYIQLNNEYDLRNCQQKITAIELNKDFLPDQLELEATSSYDTYETYPTY
ncbi:hypothetical protein SAMN05192529_13132 [Arachidicoccus rhizosphaerae]|uniref:Uncharacterized protein n=1 Tax=Arachidicoccus rhizosphaerae TaxID=551991 RepID=A0A1H4CFY4_9BACT|nr:hypothetical protein [Arachidicoccus rhizosphaerae]SEA59233.1 hypothetical protein SAMN05192529_13132 [Arachidicoccus rhizosphaerae]